MKKLLKKSMLFVLLSSLLAFGAVNVYAKHHEGGHESEKHEMNADTNQDGKVSYDEFKTAREKHMQAHFKRVDTNADGFIDEAERASAKAQWKAHKKERCERKHD